MCPFGHFWSAKTPIGLQPRHTFQHVFILCFFISIDLQIPLYLLSQIDFGKKVKFHFFAKSIWDRKTKGLSITFPVQKSERLFIWIDVQIPLYLLSQIDFAKNANFTFWAKSIWDSKTKGLSITFRDQKSPNGTMSKSSVKHCRFRMTFWTKSYKSGHFAESAYV